jgi:hypothetical protein
MVFDFGDDLAPRRWKPENVVAHVLNLMVRPHEINYGNLNRMLMEAVNQRTAMHRDIVSLCLILGRSVVTGISSNYPKQGPNPSGQGHGQGAPKGHSHSSRHDRSAAETCSQRA